MCVDSVCRVWTAAGVGHLATSESFGVVCSFAAVLGFAGFYSLPGGAELLSYTPVIMLSLIIWLFIFPADAK